MVPVSLISGEQTPCLYGPSIFKYLLEGINNQWSEVWEIVLCQPKGIVRGWVSLRMTMGWLSIFIYA